jgi:hypothetical protein
MSWKLGSLNLLEPSGPHRACYGSPLPFYICFLYNKPISTSTFYSFKQVKGLCLKWVTVVSGHGLTVPLAMQMPSTHICAVPTLNFSHIVAITTDFWRLRSTNTTISRITQNREQSTSHLSQFITHLQHANCLSRHQCHLQTHYFNEDHYYLLMLWYIYVSLLCFHWLYPSCKAVHL